MKALLAVLLALPSLAAAQAQKPFDDSGVRVSFAPQNLWRSSSGAFVGAREGELYVLTYDFFEDADAHGRYYRCPTRRGAPEKAKTCEQYHAAIDDAFALWSQAAKHVVFRRRSDPAQPVNVWVAWTDAFVGERPPVGVSVDNSRSASAPTLPTPAESFAGLAQPAHPNARKSSGALLFNDKYCWKLDEDACPPAVVLPNGKAVSNTHDIRLVSLHESGHVLGFLHFTVPSIMGLSGGSNRYELTPLDRSAARTLYARVAASLRD